MRKLNRTLMLAMVVSALVGQSNGVAGQIDDDLFSSVRASSAFSDTTATGQNAVTSIRPRLTSTAELVRLLQQAQFEVSSKGNRAASTQKSLDSWVFPVTVTVSDDEQDLSIVLGLRTVSDPQKLPATRLLQLLESNQKSGRTCFAFSQERRRIELNCLLKNSGMDAQMLRDEINRLAILARDSESAWNLDESSGGAAVTNTVTASGGATKVAPPSETGTAPTMAPSPTTSPTIVASPAPEPASAPATAVPAASELTVAAVQGRWSASRTATEAVAIQLNADNSFVLVSVSSGTQARSTGKYTLQQNQLTLDGSDGLRLVASLKLVSASEFRFEQQSAGTAGVVLTFRRQL